MQKVCYLRLHQRVMTKQNQALRLSDVARISAEVEVKEIIKDIIVHQVSPQDKSIIIIEMIKIIDLIMEVDPEIDIQITGPNQVLVEVMVAKKNWSILSFSAVWLLLFFGAGLAIMNFHEDVSMQGVHQKIYTLITGKEEKKPLLFQIPYSIGLGLGMVLFFNHLFKKRFNEEPSPLEVEMFKYQQDLDQYMIINENKESIKKLDDN
ncbi:stage V sporulation protein AA [Bacillus solimangrovi]|uniref:Stage V sporulation protein AA n=1 Tax=Bacillus solimangrovi TaxID=1305675 RepID=A0A1E5LHQ2_9BACI|nr:stage V sporulation protein AA [Bacillus solimangrovi]OEH93588.1 stage V sporulation protein AA [Bacillus solimangrovi]